MGKRKQKDGERGIERKRKTKGKRERYEKKRERTKEGTD